MTSNDSPERAEPGGSRADPEPPPGRAREAGRLAAVLAVALVLWGFGVSRLDFHRSMESSRALVAQQMLRTGDYVVPMRGSEVYLAKPPLFYWTIVGLSRLGGGVGETTVRLASALSVLALLLVTYAAARRTLGAGTALLSGAVVATTPFAFQMARDGTVDTLLALGVTLALFGAFFLLEPGRRSVRAAIVCGVGVGIGLLTKGPIVLLFLVPTAVLYVGFRREGPAVRSPRAWLPRLGGAALSIWAVGFAAPSVGRLALLGYVLPLALLARFAANGPAGPGVREEGGRGRLWLLAAGTAAAIVLPWLVLVSDRLGLDALVHKLGRELWVDRVTEVGSSNKGGPWTYLLEFPVACLPYVLFVPLTLLPGYAADASPARRRMLLFLQCWLLGSLVLFTAVSEARRDRYLFPAFPAAALLAADAIASLLRGRLAGGAATWADRILRGTVVVACLAPIALGVLWRRTGLGGSAAGVASVAAATVGAIAGVALLRIGKRGPALLVAVAFGVFGFTTYEKVGRSEEVNARSSARPGVARLRAHVPAGETLWVGNLPSYAAAFYLDGPPLGLRPAEPVDGERVERLYVVVDAAARDPAALPPGFEVEEIAREPIPGAELVLLRLLRTRSPAGG